MLRKPAIKFDDFSKGFVSKGSEISLERTQSPDCVNVHSDIFKSLQKRKGYSKLNSASGSATVSGLYNYVRDDAFQFLLSFWDGTTFKKMDNAGHAIVTGDDATPSFGTGSYLKVTIDSAGGNWAFDDIDLRSFPQDCKAVADAINVATVSGVTFTDVAYAYEDTSGFLNIMSKTSGTGSKIDIADGTSDTGDAQGEATEALFSGTTATDTGSAAAWDGTWDTIAKNANRGTTFTASTTEYAHFTTFGGDCVVTTDYRDVPQKWDIMDCEADYTDIDWETSHCYVTGDDATPTLGTGAYLKATIDGTAHDDIDLRSLTTIDQVVQAINASIVAKGWAYEDASGYLRVISNTRGASGTVVIADGTSDTGDAQGEACEALFDGTTATGTTIGTNIAPRGKLCINWHDYCWIANTGAQPDRLYYSGSGDHTSWTATHYETLITPGDVGITALAKIRGRMYAFKEHSIHRFTYLGGTPLFDIKEVESAVGTKSPRTVKNVYIPGKGEMLVYLGTDEQLYAFDGYSSTPLSEAVSTYNGISTYCMIGDGSTYGINPDQLLECHAINYVEKHWYILFFCKDNDTQCKDGFIFDYYAKSFFPIHIDQDGTDVFTASCISDNATGQRKVYVGGANYVWLFDNTNADDGGNIDAHWITRKEDGGSEVTLKDMRRAVLTTKSVACTPTFQYRCNWESSYSTAETLVTAQNEHVYDIPRTEELIQFKFADDSDDAAFEWIRLSLIAQPIGQAK